MTSSENIEETVLIFKVPQNQSTHPIITLSTTHHHRGLSQDVTFMKQICHLKKKTLLTESRGHELRLTNPNFMHYCHGKMFPPNLPYILASSSIFSQKKWVPFNDPLLKAAHDWHWWLFLSPSRLVSVSCPDLKSLALSWHEDIV